MSTLSVKLFLLTFHGHSCIVIDNAVGFSFGKETLMRKNNDLKNGDKTKSLEENKFVEKTHYTASELGLYQFFQRYRHEEESLCALLH